MINALRRRKQLTIKIECGRGAFRWVVWEMILEDAPLRKSWEWFFQTENKGYKR